MLPATFSQKLAAHANEDLNKLHVLFPFLNKARLPDVALYANFFSAVLAQSSDSLQTKTRSLHFLPIAYYTPETRLGVGGLLFKVFKTTNRDSLSRSSNAQTYCSVTLNKQFLLENEWTLFLKNERYFISGNLDYARFPEFFFGIGNNTPKSNKELYSFDLVKFQPKNLKMIAKNLLIGFQYDLHYLFKMDQMETDMVENPKVAGSDGYFTSGLGAVMRFDSRNNLLHASKGALFELQTSYYGPITLGHFRYNSFSVEWRKFLPLYKQTTIALHAYAQMNDGIVPFRALPAIGGSKYLRGFYRGRFRDKNMMVLQTELRIPLVWRLGIVAFSGVGQVAEEVSEFELHEMKYSGGFGLRYKINKVDDANLRIDLGFTNESRGLYVVFAEAF